MNYVLGNPGLGNPDRGLFLKLKLHSKSTVLSSYYLKLKIQNNGERWLRNNFQGHLTWTLVLLEDGRQNCWLTASRNSGNLAAMASDFASSGSVGELGSLQRQRHIPAPPQSNSRSSTLKPNFSSSWS